MVCSSTMLRAVNPVPAILTRLVALQDDPTSLPPEQTLKEPSTRPLPVRHRPAKLGTAATPPWNLCIASPSLCTSTARCEEVKNFPVPLYPSIFPCPVRLLVTGAARSAPPLCCRSAMADSLQHILTRTWLALAYFSSAHAHGISSTRIGAQQSTIACAPASSAAPSRSHRRAPLSAPRSTAPSTPVDYACRARAARPNCRPNEPP